jgi:protein-tyrosine kinase
MPDVRRLGYFSGGAVARATSDMNESIELMELGDSERHPSEQSKACAATPEGSDSPAAAMDAEVLSAAAPEAREGAEASHAIVLSEPIAEPVTAELGAESAGAIAGAIEEAQPAVAATTGMSCAEPTPLTPAASVETLHYRPQEGDAAVFNPEASQKGPRRTQFRVLRRRVLDAMAAVRKAGRAPLVVVTSAEPGEGKSLVAFHLAVSLSVEQNLRPVLVDADLIRRQVSRLFAESSSAGLAGCLERAQSLGGALRATDISNLSVLPAGPYSQQAIEYFGSARWHRLVEELHAAGPQYLFVLDAPPVLATTEAQYLARSADLVLFVVRSEVSMQQSVAEALEAIGSAANVALVFNGRPSTGSPLYYNYPDYE